MKMYIYGYFYIACLEEFFIYAIGPSKCVPLGGSVLLNGGILNGSDCVSKTCLVF